MLQHSNDVAQQVETPGKATVLVVQQKDLVTRHDIHVALEIALYHGWKTSKCCNRRIFSLTTCEILRHAAPFFLHASGIL